MSGGVSEATDGGGLRPGRELGGFRVVRPLGRTLWHGIHAAVGAPVALRWVPLVEGHAVSHRMALARAAQLAHPNVARVLAVLELPGGVVVATELLQGQSLQAVLETAPGGLPLAGATDIALGLCAGLHAAHEMGLEHGALTVDSVFLAELPLGVLAPKLLGLGCQGTAAQERAVPGVPAEPIEPVDPRDDQRALARILRRMLLGAAANEDGAWSPACPAPLIAAVERATQPRRADRFASVHALGRALLPFASARQQVTWLDYFVPERAPVTPSPSATHDTTNDRG